jgi:hypothetical protein
LPLLRVIFNRKLGDYYAIRSKTGGCFRTSVGASSVKNP